MAHVPAFVSPLPWGLCSLTAESGHSLHLHRVVVDRGGSVFDQVIAALSLSYK